MNLQELKQKNPAELISEAEKLGIENPSTLRKQEILFAILKKLAEKNGTSYDEEVFEFAKKWRIPARKFGTSQDFGDFVAMFCSEQATYVIGQSLVIDGGIDNTTF